MANILDYDRNNAINGRIADGNLVAVKVVVVKTGTACFL